MEDPITCDLITNSSLMVVDNRLDTLNTIDIDALHIISELLADRLYIA